MTPEEIQNLVEALLLQGETVEKLQEQMKALTDTQLALIQVQQQAADNSNANVQAAISKETAERERLTAALDAQERQLQKQLQKTGDANVQARIRNDLLEVQIDKLERAAQAEGANTDEIAENIAKLKQQRAQEAKNETERKKRDQEREKRLKLQKQAADDLGKSIGALLSGEAPDIKSLLSPDNISNLSEKFSNLDGNMAMLAKSAAKNALLEFAQATINLAIDLADAENAFMRATGASQEFARSVTNSFEATRQFGVGIEDVSNSATALFNTFTNFTFENQKTRESLTQTGAVLEKLGISNESFAQGIQIATKGLGMSADQAGQAMLDLSGFAEELGVSPERLAGQFAEAGDSLMKLGENGDEAFRDLAAAAKVTGLEVSKILNLVNQFDTFEGAARQAGKLNAALGGNFVNAMDLMMETDPAARFEMIRDSILDTGLSFDEMSYYQKNFYKDAMGLESVGDLALVLSGNMDSVSEETRKTSRDFEEQAERARVLASLQDQLNAVFMQLIPILTPLIDGLKGMVTFMAENAELVKILGGALVGFAFGPVGAVIGALAMLMSNFKSAGKEATLLGALVTGIAKPFELVGEAISFLVKEAKSFMANNPIDPETMEMITKGVRILGLVIGTVLITKLLALAAPILAIGKGAMVVVGAITAVVAVFSDLGDTLFKDNYASTFLEGLGKVAGAVGGIAEKLFFAVTPLGLMIKGVNKLGLSFKGVLETAANFVGMDLSNVPVIGSLFSGEQTGVDQARVQKAVTPASATKIKETMATAGATTIGRTAAPTAANTNIAQNSSNNTYINSGPENAVIDVRIGDEKLGRVVQKIQNKRAARAIAGRT